MHARMDSHDYVRDRDRLIKHIISVIVDTHINTLSLIISDKISSNETPCHRNLTKSVQGLSDMLYDTLWF